MNPSRRTIVRSRRALALTACLALLLPVAAEAQKKQGSLGSKDPGLLNLTGSIHFLDKGANRMPADLGRRKAEGVVYTDRIDVPARRFTEGFPGVTDRFEWFGILYTGRFYADVPGEYAWTLRSDDGSRLWIDGKQIIDNDGIHGFIAKAGKSDLTKGPHDIQLWYFQGPATEIGLQLFVKPPKGPQKAFDLADYAGPVAAAVKTLKAEATPDGIRVRLDAALLFDTAKWDLKPRAQQAIRNLGQVIAAYPSARIRVVGYTDAVGGDDYNLDLSRSRAQSVKEALLALNPPGGVSFETEGLGKANPVASNDTAAGRTLNRRVEVFIKPQASTVFEATALPEVQPQRKAPVPTARAAAPGAPSHPPASTPPPASTASAPPPAPRPGGAGPRPKTPEMVAAVNRVKYVIERYAAAVAARDRDALGQFRAAISDSERELLDARAVTVAIEVIDVNVEGTAATATCRQSIDATSNAGKPIRSSGDVTVLLTRRPAGWVITEIR